MLFTQQLISQKTIPFTSAVRLLLYGGGRTFYIPRTPLCKTNQTECARLFLGNLQFGLHVIGAS
jgi:hypothetical protein